jgi:hypothetical protein
MNQPSAAVLVLVSLVTVGCGGGSSPTAPSTPTATSIVVNSASTHVFLGNSETFTATVTLSNGTTQVLTGGTWSSDATGVATVVAGTGAVTAVASGEATIIVDAQGVRGTKRIRVVPSYQGIWFGTYTVNSCVQTGDFVDANLCGTTLIVGSNTLQAGLNLTQSIGAITGQTRLGGIFSDALTGTVNTDGTLSFQVGATVPTLTTRVAQAWQLNITQAGRITGTVTQTWTDPALTGQMVVATTLNNFVPAAQALGERPVISRSFGSLREAADVLLRGSVR